MPKTVFSHQQPTQFRCLRDGETQQVFSLKWLLRLKHGSQLQKYSGIVDLIMMT
ncbi:MAG: hypothetical protein QNJ51_29940 [Calothrix sp. MO_167.B12]|nr:hypothetical protein [Calothrix sp. MO_167.B12]